MSSSGSGFSSGSGRGFDFDLSFNSEKQRVDPGSSGQGFSFNLGGQDANHRVSNFSRTNTQRFNFGSNTPGVDFNFSAPPPSGPSTAQDLCLDCASLDLETAFARAHSLYEGARRGNNTRRIVSCRSRHGPPYLRDFYFVTSLGARLSENRSCKLCSFFKQHASDPNKGMYKVLAICSSESNLFEPPRKTATGKWIRPPWEDMEYNVFLAVVPDVVDIPRTGIPLRWLESDLPRKGSIYRLTEDVEDEEGRRLVLPEKLGSKVDRSMLDYWLWTCSHSHGPSCNPKKPMGASLRGFRAIDCTQKPPSVQDISWGEKYVALSYVWGNSVEQWPQTIKDAVVVTKMLGYKYLWVDRLCINQSIPDERMFLISKMDAIYEGAEITIISAAGDARAGLPGVGQTPRTPQPCVELNPSKGKSTARGTGEDTYLELVNVPEQEYEKETVGHTMWLDPYRHGLQNSMTLDIDAVLENINRESRWEIPRDHLDFFEHMAQDYKVPLDEFMGKQEELARRKGIQLAEIVPYLQREAAKRHGILIPDDEPLPPVPGPSITDSRKAEVPLPPGKVPGKTVLVSTMQDPRITIRKSRWATRGWTYQEGVLSRRCLVFTPQQVYWECRCMAVNESFRLPLPTLHSRAKSDSHWTFGSYMLSGLFRGDMHQTPELQYGFPGEDNSGDDVTAQVKRLDSHIRAFTSRKLADPQDSWNAFLGVAARYTGKAKGLSLVLGIPYWAGLFANGQPALQHSFAVSVSVWFHVGRPVEPASLLRVASCVRRARFPSWSWTGWEGTAEFINGNTVIMEADAEGSNDNDDRDQDSDNFHIEYFKTMTDPSWATSIDRIWSADMVLQSEDGSASTVLHGNTPLHDFADPAKRWLLVIKKPLVLKHLYLMHTRDGQEWRRLMGKLVELHLSLPLTEEELTVGHKSGDLVTVLIFASTVPFVWDGRAQFLVLRRASNTKGDKWERIGRLVLSMEEHVMDKYQNSQDMINDLPVRGFGRDITIV
ncbi:hypothetical protein GGS24DRAFT_487544 [Hypoxylon argillaceum]|nr:hypothetical protein GGS24DRAFT_487544 [Hypoxylon argillaceum]